MKVNRNRVGDRRLYLALAVLIIAIVYFLQSAPLGVSVNDDVRDYKELVYTKHAKCRMDCREINEREIKEIIADGKLNKAKSGYDKKHKNQTYALEGYSYQKQHIRVVVAPKNQNLLVITVIDLDKDWACDCN